MSKMKRNLRPVMLYAETHIEKWRRSLLKGLHRRTDVANYLLVSVACADIAVRTLQMMPQYPSRLELLLRNDLTGLQFSISGVGGELPSGKFIKGLTDRLLSTEHARLAREVLQKMYSYALARDAFLTYIWGGYELESSEKNLLRFIDSPDWSGTRDHAQRIIGQEIKENQLRSHKSSLVLPIQLKLEQAVNLPASLPLGGLTAGQFVYAWAALTVELSNDWLSGQVRVIEKVSIARMVESKAHLSASEASRFVSLVTFDRDNKKPFLTLCHCPLVPVTTSSLIPVSPGFVFGNPETCIPRLAVHRGPGLNKFANESEVYFLQRLRDHFHKDEVTINTRVSYSSKEDKGDIDLVIYNKLSNQLLIAMAKAFIPPDTVDEVIRANQTLEEGLQQIRRVQQWLKTINRNSWSTALQTATLPDTLNIKFVLIANAFAGSNYLEIPYDITIVDIRYLLLSKFKGMSIFDAIDEYQKRISEETDKAPQDRVSTSIELGDITIELPAWTHTV